MNNNFEEDNTMKKTYETPSVEVVKFLYRDQVVATSGCIVSGEYSHEVSKCSSQDASAEYTK